MTPQSTFMVVAPIDVERIGALRTLLGTMNLPASPGMADPNNPIVRFGDFDTLHYARFVILDDRTLDDFAKLHQRVPSFPVTLAFLGDCDGPAEDFLNALVQLAAPGLEKIFSHCEYFTPGCNLLQWMQQHSQRPAATYVNWIGRTVRQIREEAALRAALVKHINSQAAQFERAKPQEIREKLKSHFAAFKLTPPEKTPFAWCLRNLLHFAIVPCALLLPWMLAIPFLFPLQSLFFWIVIPFLLLDVLVFLWLVNRTPIAFAVLTVLGLWLVPLFILFPLLLIPLMLAILVFLCVLRWHETSEPEIIFRPTRCHDVQLAKLEDHDVTNQFTALGSVKPGVFRHALFTVILWLVNYGARHVYNRGYLSRIQSIHFARWVFLDGKRRMLFASNYDGSHQAYMDDFINKVGWGLNIVFSNGFGYPRTNWLIKDGAKNELRFKDTNRRHQLATQVWYKAYPGFTAFDLARNARVREGLQQPFVTDEQIRIWLRDL